MRALRGMPKPNHISPKRKTYNMTGVPQIPPVHLPQGIPENYKYRDVS